MALGSQDLVKTQLITLVSDITRSLNDGGQLDATHWTSVKHLTK